MKEWGLKSAGPWDAFQSAAIPLAALLAFLLSQIYILPKVLHSGDGLDFRLLWLAGRIWAEGGDPYGPLFLSRYVEIFGAGPDTHFWVYPPNWASLLIPLSALDFRDAVLLWNVLNLACILAGCWLLFSREIPKALFLAALVCTMQGTVVALAIGQTAMIVFLGICLFLRGWRGGSRSLLFLGLLLLALKPNIAIPFFAVASVRRAAWGPALLAVLAAGAMSLPVLSLETLAGFRDALGRYGAAGLTANAPPNMTGLAHLLDLAGLDLEGQGLGSGLLVGLAALCAMLAAARSLPLMFASVGFIVPLHTYDLPFVMITAAFVSRRALLAAVGLAVLWRAGIFAGLGLVHPRGDIFPDSLAATIGVMLVALGFLPSALRRSG